MTVALQQKQKKQKSAQRLFTGVVGLFEDEPVAPTAPVGPTEPPQQEPAVSKPKRGRPPKGERAATPAERKRVQRSNDARQNQIAVIVADQQRDYQTGGLYGPGHAAKGGGIDKELAVAEKKWRTDPNDGESFYDEAKNGKVNTSYSKDDETVDASEVAEDKVETDSTFQERHPVKKNWKYDEREKQEIARKEAAEFITSFSTAEFVWDVAAKDFVCVRKQMWCETCHKVIPAEHRCTICNTLFWSLAEAVEHIISSIDNDEGDETHRRRVLKGISRPHYIPKVDAKVREFYDEICQQAEAISRAAGWVKRNGEWVWE